MMQQTTHTVRPSFAVNLTAQLVFLRIFFLPCGVNVDKHVLHGALPGGAVRQSTCGMLDDVPVPRKMSSIGAYPLAVRSEDDSMNVRCSEMLEIKLYRIYLSNQIAICRSVHHSEMLRTCLMVYINHPILQRRYRRKIASIDTSNDRWWKLTRAY